MSKMGQELEDRLDANKYELLEALKALLFQFAMAVEHPYSKDKEVYNQANRVLAKIDGR